MSKESKRPKIKAIWELPKGHQFARPAGGRGGKHQDKTRYSRKNTSKPANEE